MVALLTYGLIQKAPDTSIGESLARGKPTPAPSFDLEILDAGVPPGSLRPLMRRAAADGTIALEELRGAPTVINFWASWCAPCRQEAELLQQTWRRVGKEGVLFLGINMQDARSDARAFIEEFGLDYPSVREPARETGSAYGATGIPETYFLTADGRVVGRHVGPIEVKELRAGISAARTGRVLGAQENAPKPELRLVPVEPKREKPAPEKKAPAIPAIVVRGGEPVGGVAELSFDAGEVVRFKVESDVADELHLHGYDISKPVAAGGSATFEFPADIEGIFELELEERAVPLAELQVNP